jgi:tetratricopeptide (TPR) repeat protein
MSGIEELHRAIADEGVVMLVGAGVSIDPPAGLPDWTRLRDLTVSAIAAQHPGLTVFASMVSEVPMISLPDRKGLAPEMVASFISASCSGYFESFRALEEGTPNYNHRLIAAMAARGLIKYLLTTNFDTFLEAALDEAGVPYVVYRDDREFRDFRLSETAQVHVLKLHGSLDLPESITATVEQEARGLTAAKVSALDLLLDGRWLAVWGYSGADLKIDIDYLRLLRNKDSCHGFFWNMFQDPDYTEQPNKFVLDLAKAYGPDRAVIAGSLFPGALERVLPPALRPVRPVIDAQQRAALQQHKNEQLERRLADWALAHVDAFSACIVLGDLLRYAGYSTEAMHCYREGDVLARQASDHQALAYAAAMQADLAMEIGLYDSASALWDQVSQAADLTGDVGMVVRALSGQSSLANRRGDLVQSERLNAMIASIRSTGPAEQTPTFLLSERAVLKRNQGDYDESYALMAQTAERHRASGERMALATALRGMASANLKFGEFKEALAALSEAKESDTGIGNRTGVVLDLIQLAQLQMGTGEYAKAAESLAEAEDLAQAVEDDNLVLSLREMRLMWHSMQSGADHAVAALPFAEDTINGLRRLGETRRLGVALSHLANLQTAAGHFIQASEARREAMQTLLRAEDRLNAAHMAEIMASEASKSGQDSEAFTFFQLAIANLRIAGMHHRAADLLGEMRPVLARLEQGPPWTMQSVMATVDNLSIDRKKALIAELGYGTDSDSAALADCVQDIARSSGDATAAYRLNVALKVQAEQDYQEGRDWSEWTMCGLRLSKLVRDDYATGIYLNDLGVAKKVTGDLSTAISCYSSAAEIAGNLGDLLEVSVRMHNLAIALAMAERKEESVATAVRAGQAALAIVRAGRLRSLMNAATLLDEFRQWDAALTCFTEAAYEASGVLDEKTLARAYQGRGKALRELGAFEESAAAREAAARMYRATGDGLTAAIMLFLAGNTLIQIPGRNEYGKSLLNAAMEAAATENDENLTTMITEALEKFG